MSKRNRHCRGKSITIEVIDHSHDKAVNAHLWKWYYHITDERERRHLTKPKAVGGFTSMYNNVLEQTIQRNEPWA